MQKSILVTLVTIAVLTGVLVWWYSDLQVVKRQSNKLLDSLTVTGAETKSFKLLKTNIFTNLLAGNVTCRVDIANYRSQFSYDELEEKHHLFVSNVTSSSFKADEMSIDFSGDNEARVSAGLSLSVTGKGGHKLSEQCQLGLHWAKNPDGKWRLTLIEINRKK